MVNEIKILIDGDRVGCDLYENGSPMFWEALTEREKMLIVRALADFHEYFYKKYLTEPK